MPPLIPLLFRPALVLALATRGSGLTAAGVEDRYSGRREISSVSPLVVGSGGGAVLSVHGRGLFSSATALPIITVGAADCPLLLDRSDHRTGTMISCRLPAGADGLDAQVRLHLGSTNGDLTCSSCTVSYRAALMAHAAFLGDQDTVSQPEGGTLLLNLHAPMLSHPDVQLRAFIGKGLRVIKPTHDFTIEMM